MADSVTLTIDDRQVTVPTGTLVVDAARALGIQIPVFCSHPQLHPVGVCRMCMVEYVSARGNKVDVSCTVPVTEGMVVRTDTAAVKAAREAMLGFLLINHPLDCPICDKGGECPLQDQTLQYGPGASQFVEEKVHKAKHYPVSELIMLDQERCVLCWRCIRYLDEWEDRPQLQLHKRGDRTVIDTFPGRPVDAHTSGSVIDICPVGALTDRTARFNYRPWELQKTASICTLCPVGCNLRLDERVHELRRIVARENPAVNQDWICDKGRFLHDYVDHPERLRTPLVRENGTLRAASWDEALRHVVARLTAVIDEYGAKAVGGVAAARVSNEAAYLFQKFFRTLAGNNNVDFPTGSVVRAAAGSLTAIADIAQSDLIVLVGLDTGEVTPVLDLFIKRAVTQRGARVVVVNARRTELARQSDGARYGTYLPVRPGAEGVALNGLAAWLVAQRAAAGRQERTRAGRPSPAASAARPETGPNDEWGWLQGFTPEQAQATSGVPLAGLASSGELLLQARRPLFLYGADVATGARGAATVAALANLAGLLGHGDRLAYIPTEANSQGARDMGLLPNALPGHQPLGDAAVRERLAKLWGVVPPAEPGLSYDQMVSGAVKGLFVMGANPAVDPVAAQSLRQLDFLVVQDLFLTETAQLADVVLPATSSAEADGTYTNLERRVQRAPMGVRAAGESRSDWQILAALAGVWQARQAGQAVPATVAAEAAQPDWKHRGQQTGLRQQTGGRQGRGGPGAKPWNCSSIHAVLEEIGRVVPFYAGLRWESLGASGVQWPSTAAPRAPLAARAAEAAQVAAVAAPPDGSFWLATGPLMWGADALMRHGHPQVQKLMPPPFVALNPADLARAGLVEDRPVKVASERGAVSLVLRADPAVQPGAAWIPLALPGYPAEGLGAGRGESVAVRIAG